MRLTFVSAVKRVKTAKNPKRCWILHGDETMKEEIYRRLCERYSLNDERVENRCKTSDIQNFLMENSLIKIDRLWIIPEKNVSGSWNNLAPVVGKGDDWLAIDQGRKGKETALVKAMKGRAYWVRCRPLKEEEIRRWAEWETEKPFSRDAWIDLKRKLGISILDWLEAVAILKRVASDKKITLKQTRQVPPGLSTDDLALVKAMMTRDRREVMRLLEGEGEIPLVLTRLLQRQFTLLEEIKVMRSRGMGLEEINDLLQLPMAVAKDYFGMVSSFSQDVLRKLLDVCLDAETKFKGRANVSYKDALVISLLEEMR